MAGFALASGGGIERMKWKDFVALQNASDETLDAYGLIDNFPILWRAFPTEGLVAKLRATGRYGEHSIDNDITMSRATHLSAEQREQLRQDYSENLLAHRDGTIVVNPKVSKNIYTPRGLGNEDYNRLLNFQTSRYDFALRIHTDQLKRMPGFSSVQAMHLVVRDIVETVFLPENVPFCLPKVFIYKQGQKKQDYSTIVYWPYFDEEEMCRT